MTEKSGEKRTDKYAAIVVTFVFTLVILYCKQKSYAKQNLEDQKAVKFFKQIFLNSLLETKPGSLQISNTETFATINTTKSHKKLPILDA